MSLSERLHGTWLLVSAEDVVDGVWQKPFGEKPKGYFSFDSSGRVSVQFMRWPETGKSEYLAYFGTYTVDESASTFTTLVEGALNPKQIGASLTRRLRIEDDTLFITDPEGQKFRRTFVRAT